MSDLRPTDPDTLRAQLGRPIRGLRSVPCRCADGHPTVVETEPRLPDGTPFPTLYYLTCPEAVLAVSGLESVGVMKEMTDGLAADPDLLTAYQYAHDDYLARREAIMHVPEVAGMSAGGMPSRVKCLHALLAHSLAVGRGVNPIGDATLERIDWSPATCTWSASAVAPLT